MCLEVGRLIGQHPVSSRVRLVEAVLGELRHQVENTFRLRAIQSSFGSALDEHLTVLGHLLGLLLAHRASEQVGLPE